MSEGSGADWLAQLKGDLGDGDGRASARRWEERIPALGEYVARPGRLPLDDYRSIREYLESCWGIPVVELADPVGESEPLGGADRDRGRCGIRLLDLVGSEAIYIVVRRTLQTSDSEALWTLLHELGHLAHHFEMLQSVSTVYQRICLNPGLEAAIGTFANGDGQGLRASLELEADLFALDWLLPRWIYEDQGMAPEGMTLDGHRFASLRRTLGAGIADAELSPAAIERLNRAGAEEARRSEGVLAAGATRWSRTAWLLWNRHRFQGGLASSELLDQYYAIAGSRSRYVPELRSPVLERADVDPASAWLRRVSSETVAEQVDGGPWEPLLLPGPDARYPAYNLPIRPLPSPNPRDSDLLWSHMFKPPTQRSLPLMEWVERARDQSAGLLLFARNPAERALDESGVPRS